MKYIKFVSVCLVLITLFNFTVFGKTVTCDEDISDINEPIECAVTNLSVGADLNISAKGAVLMEPYTGETLYDKNSSEVLAPASITKIMSLLIIMEAIDRKELALNEIVTTSEHAASMGGSQIWLKEGETMTVDELLKATAVASANDATVALAEKYSGSEECFVALMNKRAKELGMKNTVFKNCTGLDEEGHITSAYDVALMSCELIKHDTIKKYTTIWMDSLRNGESELVNTNKLVRFYKGATGLKTGTTSIAGSCLSASAKRDNTEFVAVVMGAPNSKERFSDAKKLLDFGFANYKTEEIFPKATEKELTAKVENGTQKTVTGEVSGSIKILTEKSKVKEIVQKVNLNKNISAPVKKGDLIGNIEIFSDNEQIGRMEIKAKENVEKLGFSVVLKWILCGITAL